LKWFKHDSNALHDAKIEKLIMKYGIEGYGMYFACVEMIAEKLSAENMSFELEHDAELLAHKFKIDSKRTEEIMKCCVALNLFQYSEESNKIFCQALSRRVDNTTAQNPQFKTLIESMKTQKLETNLSNLKLLQETCSIGEESRVEKKREEKPPFRPVKPLEVKKEYAEGVLLTDTQFWKLATTYGEPMAKKLVDTLSSAKQAKGYKYKSDYHAILSWVVEKCKAEPLAERKTKGWKCPHCGETNTHNDSRCMKCRKDRDDPVEEE